MTNCYTRISYLINVWCIIQQLYLKYYKYENNWTENFSRFLLNQVLQSRMMLLITIHKNNCNNVSFQIFVHLLFLISACRCILACHSNIKSQFPSNALNCVFFLRTTFCVQSLWRSSQLCQYLSYPRKEENRAS